MFFRKHPFLAFVLAMVLLLLVAVAVAYWRWTHPPPLPAIPYGPRTTVVDQPRHPDGTVDYLTPFQAKIAPVLASEQNAARLLVQAVGPDYYWEDATARILAALELPPTDEDWPYFIDPFEYLLELKEDVSDLDEGMEKATSAPWTGEEFPLIQTWIEGIAEPLALVEQASRLPLYAMPLDVHQGHEPPLLAFAYGLVPGSYDFGPALSARAFLRLGEGDLEGCSAEGATLCRIAGLAWQEPGVIAVLQGCKLAYQGHEVLRARLRNGAIEAAEARSLLSELQAVQVPRVRDLLEHERLAALDMCMASIRGLETSEVNPAGFAARPSFTMPGGLLDPESVLTTVNQYFDTLEGFLGTGEIPDLPGLHAYIGDLQEAPEPDWSLAGLLAMAFRVPSEDLGVSTGQTLAAVSSYLHRKTIDVLTRTRLQHFFLLAALLLECDRLERGRPPDSLRSIPPRLRIPETLFTELSGYVDHQPRGVGFRLGPSAALHDLRFDEECLLKFDWTVGSGG